MTVTTIVLAATLTAAGTRVCFGNGEDGGGRNTGAAPVTGDIDPEATAECEAYVTAARKAYATAEYADYRTSIVDKYAITGAARKLSAQYRQPAAGTVRWIRVEGMANFRDIGGWTGLKTHLVYRGSEPDCNTNATYLAKGNRSNHDLFATAKGLDVLSRELGIKTDFDLRSVVEDPTPDTTPIPGARLVRIPVGAYAKGLATEKGRKAYADALRVFADERNYPIYFHCYGGADRTGTLAFLLEGLCGVSEADLSVEYELTTFGLGRRPRYDKPYFFASLVAEMKKEPGANVNAQIENYVHWKLGLTESEIRAIRKVLTQAGR